MRRWAKIISVILLSLLTFISVQNSKVVPNKNKSGITREATSAAKLNPQTSEEATVLRVIDGDTIELSDKRRIRYIGIDTPETVDPRKPVQCFGKEASNENKRLVEGKSVRLEKDISETDQYGRLLRYVYVDNTFVNDYLVRQGFAHASTFPPDVKYADKFREAQAEAQENNRGLWAGCPVGSNESNTNSESSEINTVISNPSISPNSSCLIKGNISTSGERIYHLPGCGSYDKTVIDESAGERWFCTEDEAVTAGWRKAKNC